MSTEPHDAVVRRSFTAQTELFEGDDAVFARLPGSAVGWVAPLDPRWIVLEVACGAAHAAERIAPHVRQVVGLDVTPALLRLGADRLGAAGIDNVLLQEGNATALPFLDASFDLVVCRSSVHHFPQPAGPLAEMARVCRPGGRVVVADMVAPNADVQPAFDALHRRIDPSHAHALLEPELVELLRSTVGPVRRVERAEPFRLRLDDLLTDVAERDDVVAVLRAEVDGGPGTGFAPSLDREALTVAFLGTTVHAERPAP
jgi:SAM-dependent methyltransferase